MGSSWASAVLPSEKGLGANAESRAAAAASRSVVGLVKRNVRTELSFFFGIFHKTFINKVLLLLRGVWSKPWCAVLGGRAIGTTTQKDSGSLAYSPRPRELPRT